MNKYLFTLTLLVASAFAQKPMAELPRMYLDTTYAAPVGGRLWPVHTAAQFTAALSGAVPGDVIVLDAGVTYSGNFHLTAKPNPSHKWIYIVTGNFIENHAEGKRVAPTDASAMARIQTPNATTTFAVDVSGAGANYWRLVGLEITAASNYPTGCGTTTNCFSYGLIQVAWPPTATPDHIYVDRCYIHGTPTQDIQGAVSMNGSNYALFDSYVDEIHAAGVDSWGAGAFVSPGPIKITNNYIAASSENIIFGGSGGGYNGYVSSDIEIRNNYLYKPLSWIPLNMTDHKMVVKNAFELKSAQRVLFDGNTIENVWAGGQLGSAVVLTIRSSQSGDMAVVNDVTVTNNVLKNVVAFVNTLALDDNCGIPPYTACKNPGSQARWNISNNLVTFFDPNALGGNRNIDLQLHPSINRFTGVGGQMHDIVYQHNTVILNGTNPCWSDVYFDAGQFTAPPPTGLTNNIWILDNVMCKQPFGTWGNNFAALNKYMDQPSTPPNDINSRFSGNVMLKGADPLYTWPAKNLVATSLTFDPQGKLTAPTWTQTTDGKQVGYAPVQGNKPAPPQLKATPK